MTYTNDLFGRRTTKTTPSATTTYTYNASGQLAGVATPSMSAKYSYGISGMREAKIVTSAGTTSSTTSLWAGMQLVAERDLDGTTYRYLYGPRGAPLELSVTASGGVATSYAYQLDHAGSVIALTSATGTVVASYAYDPWGNPTSVGGTNPKLAARQPLRYRGYYWDGESALYYMPARYYDPSVGRFISADPAAPSAGSPLSLNRYVYCEGDPVQNVDPDGREMLGYMMHMDQDAGIDRDDAYAYHTGTTIRSKDGGIHSPKWYSSARAGVRKNRRNFNYKLWGQHNKPAGTVSGAQVKDYSDAVERKRSDLVARSLLGVNEGEMERIRSGDVMPLYTALLSGGGSTAGLLVAGGVCMVAAGGAIGLGAAGVTATVVGAPVGVAGMVAGAGLATIGGLTAFVGVEVWRIQTGQGVYIPGKEW